MLNYKSERDKKTNTGNSALGKLSTLRGYIYISHSDEVYRRCCTWGFVSCAVRQVIMSRRLRPYYAEKSFDAHRRKAYARYEVIG